MPAVVILARMVVLVLTLPQVTGMSFFVFRKLVLHTVFLYSCLCTKEFNGQNCDTLRETCGYEILDFEAGILSYPLTNDTTTNTYCVWVIKNSNGLGKVLNITFTKFNIGSSNDCTSRGTSLTLFDGPSYEHKPLGPFCGSNLPGMNGNFLSTFNVVTLRLKKGFLQSPTQNFDLNWLTTERLCGGRITGMTHGRLESPTSRRSQTSTSGPLDCRWEVVADFGQRIQFVFNHLQLPAQSSNCPNFLELKEGIGYASSNNSANTIMRFCNWTSSPEFSVPAPITSSGSTVTVLYRLADSVASLHGNGFQLLFHQVPGICGGLRSGKRGTLSPPMRTTRRDDLVYMQNTACDWLIRALPTEKISLRFLSFEVEEGSSRVNGIRVKTKKCIHDVLEVFDGEDTTAPIIARLCGTILPPEYTTTGRFMRVRWRSDGSVDRKGFVAEYVSVVLFCKFSYLFTILFFSNQFAAVITS